MSSNKRVSASQLQATKAVNGLLSKILPGSADINLNKKHSQTGKKGSKAQLIDHNLKKRVALQQRNTLRIKKKQKKLKHDKIKDRKNKLEELEQKAKLEVLRKHKLEGTLTERENKYLQLLLEKNVSNAKSWELNNEDKEELLEIQNFILDSEMSKKNSLRSNRRRSKIKQFKEEIKTSGSNSQNVDRRYPGLTPGLAPVGLSDEEESSSEEDDY